MLRGDKIYYTLGGIQERFDMSKFFKFLAASMIALFSVASLSACATSESVDMTKIAAVIDVRTPAEYAAGHLEGALNIDVQGMNFAAELEALDKTADYVVYCRSGNRSGQAIAQMESLGFTGNLTNAGGVDAASQATGLAIVQ